MREFTCQIVSCTSLAVFHLSNHVFQPWKVEKVWKSQPIVEGAHSLPTIMNWKVGALEGNLGCTFSRGLPIPSSWVVFLLISLQWAVCIQLNVACSPQTAGMNRLQGQSIWRTIRLFLGRRNLRIFCVVCRAFGCAAKSSVYWIVLSPRCAA